MTLMNFSNNILSKIDKSDLICVSYPPKYHVPLIYSFICSSYKGTFEKTSFDGYFRYLTGNATSGKGIAREVRSRLWKLMTRGMQSSISLFFWRRNLDLLTRESSLRSHPPRMHLSRDLTSPPMDLGTATLISSAMIFHGGMRTRTTSPRRWARVGTM
jgi:hypothetical protein